MSDELVKRLRGLAKDQEELAPYDCYDDSDELREAADRIEALEAALSAALERLDASLFTNAEHQQAKDILREARKPSLDA